MRRHHLIVLIVVAVVSLVAALWVSDIREIEGQDSESVSLVPGLKESLNTVAGVKIVGPGNTTLVTVTRGEETWTVAEKDGYPAGVAKLRAALLDLAESRVLAEKTRRAENYDRLGVEDTAAEDASGVRVELVGVDLDVAIIVGKAAVGGKGRYVRHANEETSLEATGELTFDTGPGDWIDKTILDVDSERVRTIEVTRPDGSRLAVAKDDPTQTAMDVSDVPAGRSLVSPTAANSMANAWSKLDLDDVTTSRALTADTRPAVTVVMSTFDGLTINAAGFELEDGLYFGFEAVYTEEEPETAAETDTADAGPAEAGEVMEQEPLDIEPVDPKIQAETINARVSGWIYKLPSWKEKQIARSMEDLLKPVDE